MSGLVLYDDAAARGFRPFALTRPAGELRAGAALIRERWARTLDCAATAFVGAPHLADFEEFDAPPAARGQLAAGDWVVNARCAPSLAASSPTAGARVLRCNGRVAAVRLGEALPLSALGDGTLSLESLVHGPEATLDGWWLEHAWDLVGLLPTMLLADVQALLPVSAEPQGMTVLGEHGAHAERGARIEPYVVADTTAGPVLVRAGAHVQSFTRLVGPCVIGEGSTVMGGRVACCSIGPQVKVAGEMSVTIMIGHANKGHDGFVGHSVIGRWANLGAGTITSNLKNSYGVVTMHSRDGMRSTGLQFLGALIGDHAKTGIGTRIPTGSVIGAAANVFGTRMPPKVVPPFAWGDGEPWDTFALDRFLTVAARVMGRRGVLPPPGSQAHWTRLFAMREDA